MQKRIYIK